MDDSVINYIFREGTGGGAPLVFLHGWGGDCRSLDALALRLPAYDRYSPDLFGFGLTPLKRVMTVDEYADGIAEWMERIIGEAAVVVAHSFGGRVAISLSARHSEMVKGLALISSAGVRLRRSATRTCKIAAYRLRRAFGLDTSRCGSADYRAAQGDLRGVLALAVRNFQEEQLKKICVPVLIISGKSDKDTPPYTAKKMSRLVRDGALIELDGGHFCYLDNASVVAAMIDALAGGAK